MNVAATPEEAKVLNDIAAGIEAGDDVFGDNDPLETVDDDATGPDDGSDADDASATQDEAAQNEAQPTQAEQQTQEQQPPQQQFTAQVPTDYKEQRTALTAEKSQALKKLMDGEIDADQYAAIDSRVAEAIADLDAARIRAETLIEANAQNQAAFQQRAIQKLIAATKNEVDYAADPKAQKQFDTAMNTIMADPDNAGLEYTELLAQAHRVVAAVRGVQTAPAAKPPAAAADRRPTGTPPVTLRNIPAASTPNANGDINDQLGRLKGQDYEAAFAKLSPAQQRALLDE